jgi:deoxyribose-phosphate aldolase
MIRAIRAYQAATGFKVGYKPAGGISKAKDALVYMAMMKEELGDRWLRPDLFRFGASRFWAISSGSWNTTRPVPIRQLAGIRWVMAR